MPPRSSTRRTPIILTALVLWLAFSLGWSDFLIRQGSHRFAERALLTKAQQLAAILPAVPISNSATSTNALRAQELLDQSAMLDKHLAYIMAWSKEGVVLLHTNHALIGTILDVNKWPALDSARSSRITALSVPANASAAPADVLEVTLPLTTTFSAAGDSPASGPAVPAAAQTRSYLSLAYPQDYLAAESWQATEPLFLFAAAFSLVGSILLVLVILQAFARLDRSRREIEQTARARTSLLTERGMLASVWPMRFVRP